MYIVEPKQAMAAKEKTNFYCTLMFATRVSSGTYTVTLSELASHPGSCPLTGAQQEPGYEAISE